MDQLFSMDSLISGVKHVLGHLSASGRTRKLRTFWRSSQKTWPYLRCSPPSRKRSSRPTSLRKRNHAERNAWFPEIISHAHIRKSMTLRAFIIFVIKELPSMLPTCPRAKLWYWLLVPVRRKREDFFKSHSEAVKIFFTQIKIFEL